ncbi:MAG: hypothetical protein IPK83_05070 [Planctomycetes bacterium]|nr:hypothetical protein [Planctomycetota bacterium]
MSSADVLPIREAKSAQQRLREETSAAIRSMGEMAKGLESSDGAAAASLDRAVEQSTRSQVLEHMATATGEIDQARLRRARESQSKAIAGLRTMLAAMDERPERELAALAKKMTDLVAQLQRIIQEQEKLIDDTQAAQGQSAQSALSARLAGRQRALASTSEAVSIDGIGGDSMAAKFAIMTAVAHMGAAAALLDRGDATSSIEEQEHARVQLIEAMESLKEMLEREEREMAERSLAAIVESLASIRNNQHDLLQETSLIVDRQGSDERISRADGILLKLAARKQGELTGSLVEVMERMRGSIVFRRVCERTRERMSTAQAQMDASEPRQAAKEQAAIVESLDRLILVLDSRPKKKGEGYVDQDAGGEGAAPATQPRRDPYRPWRS